MDIVVARPPMFEEIDAKFSVAGRPVVFTWGTTIYNPEGVAIPPAIKAHESVHAQRQLTLFAGTGGAVPPEERIRSWWERYLLDPEFRYTEELAAHRAEYRAMRGWTKDRNQVAQYLHQIATRLASPLYGGVVGYTEARRAIVAERG